MHEGARIGHLAEASKEAKKDVHIRPYSPSDCTPVVDLMRNNFKGPAFYLYPPDVRGAYVSANSEADLRHAVDQGGTEAYVAETGDGLLAGFTLIRYNTSAIPRRNAYGELDLRRLHVNSDVQGAGVGKKLFALVEERAKAHNVEFVTSHASGSSRLFFEHQGWTGKTLLDHMKKRGTSSIVFATEKRVAPPTVALVQQPTHIVYAGSNEQKAAQLQSILDRQVMRVNAEESKTSDVVEAAKSKALSATKRLQIRGNVPLVVANDIRTDILVLNPPGDTTRYSFINRGKPSNSHGIDGVLANFKLMHELAQKTKRPAPYVVRSATYLHSPQEPDIDSFVEEDVSVWLTEEGLSVLSTPEGLRDYRDEVFQEYGIDITDMAAGFALPIFLKRGWVAGLFGHPFATLPNKEATIQRAIDIVIGGINENAVKARLGKV